MSKEWSEQGRTERERLPVGLGTNGWLPLPEEGSLVLMGWNGVGNHKRSKEGGGNARAERVRRVGAAREGMSCG